MCNVCLSVNKSKFKQAAQGCRKVRCAFATKSFWIGGRGGFYVHIRGFFTLKKK